MGFGFARDFYENSIFDFGFISGSYFVSGVFVEIRVFRKTRYFQAYPVFARVLASPASFLTGAFVVFRAFRKIGLLTHTLRLLVRWCRSRVS